MKFRHSIVVDQPLGKVADLFADPNNLKEWQDGFQEKILLSGTAGENGAVSKILFKYGNQSMELEETITSNQLPDSFEARYHHKHMDNTLKSSFIAISEKQTEYIMEGEYSRFSWVIPKLISIIFPSMYKNQGKKWMQNFKRFAENISE